jgi:biopolymer transport protein ExbB/TolQ
MAKFIAFIINDFFHVAPILAVGAFGLFIMAERTRALLFSYPLDRMDAFFEKIRVMVMADRLADAMALCERFRGKPVATVVRAGLMRADQPESLIEDGLQIAVGEVQERIGLRTGFLATIANVATLLGLFGTILGLIQSFEAVGNANASERSALLAAGISTAMNATMLGLGTAIPCMIAYSFLMNRTNRLNGQVERAALKVTEILKHRYFSAASAEVGLKAARAR